MIEFNITGEHKEKYNEFYEKHRHKLFYRGAIGGGFTFLVHPTSIGDAFEVQCDICKKKLTLQELE